MKSFRTVTRIRASAEAVWTILTDGAGYPAWNSTVERLEGRIALGEQVVLRTKADPGRSFPLKISELQPLRRMVWSGGMPLGLFKGERTYTLAPQGDGTASSRWRKSSAA